MNQDKQTVLITGCSSGFGKETAAHFQAKDWNVIATMRSPERSPFKPNESLFVTSLDVTDRESISSAIACGIQHFGRIDALVNNAGIGLFGAHEATSDAVIREIFETNTFGVIAMNRAIIPHMRERRSGVLVNVTSSVGIAPMPLVAAYTASKWAIEGFSESLSYELGAFGVRVKVVQPGLSPSTRFAANSGGRCDHLVPPAYADFAGRYLASMQDYPTAFTTAQDVAAAVYSAVTDEGNRLRFPAGADSMMLAELRASQSPIDFMDRVREMTGAALAG